MYRGATYSLVGGDQVMIGLIDKWKEWDVYCYELMGLIYRWKEWDVYCYELMGLIYRWKPSTCFGLRGVQVALR